MEISDLTKINGYPYLLKQLSQQELEAAQLEECALFSQKALWTLSIKKIR